MKTYAKRVSVLLASALMMGTFAACGNNNNASSGSSGNAGTGAEASASTSAGKKGATIKWMHHFGEESARDWIDQITTKFTEETGIKVDVQAVGYDDYQTLLKTKISSGDAPDLFDLTPSDLPMFTKNNYIADLSNANFWGNLIDGTQGNTATDGINYFLESREKKFADDQVFMDNLVKFRKRHDFGNNDQFGTDWNKATELVATGKAAMTINGNWAVGAIKEKNPDARIGAFAVPVTDNPDETVITSWLSGGFVVYEDSPVKDEVMQFLDYLTSKESGEIWLAAGRLSSVKDLPEPSDPALADINRYMNEGQAFDVSSMKVDFSQEFLNAEVDVFTQFLMDEITDPLEAAKLLDKKFDEIAAKQAK
ncbi:ABC transporter substrate-binding protein [Cohnella fermenti]|uniref:Extracellular solute-binding protein n=1 Tax=Cohnella fermenti TaxID=2565925 RepID=A0A4S4BIT9_9BACL|nr:extracellular solute-binding protein [Cohnella fermenti]THF74316.1 extracellular solute-binding protein [Cohnella fermenti]